jgi:hypothetical protein
MQFLKSASGVRCRAAVCMVHTTGKGNLFIATKGFLLGTGLRVEQRGSQDDLMAIIKAGLSDPALRGYSMDAVLLLEPLPAVANQPNQSTPEPTAEPRQSGNGSTSRMTQQDGQEEPDQQKNGDEWRGVGISNCGVPDTLRGQKIDPQWAVHKITLSDRGSLTFTSVPRVFIRTRQGFAATLRWLYW